MADTETIYQIESVGSNGVGATLEEVFADEDAAIAHVENLKGTHTIYRTERTKIGEYSDDPKPSDTLLGEATADLPEDRNLYEGWSLQDLKDELGNRQLPVSGTKPELTERLIEDDSERLEVDLVDDDDDED